MSESHPESEEGFANRQQVVKGNRLSAMDKKLNLLNEKVDKLLHFQEDMTGRLQEVNLSIDGLGRGLHMLTLRTPLDPTEVEKKGLKPEDGPRHHQMDTQNVCSEILKLMKATHQDASKHREKLEKMVDSMDKVVKYLGEMFKNSKVVDFILKGGVPWRRGSLSLTDIPEEAKDKPDEKGAQEKHAPVNKGIQAESKNSLEENKGEKQMDDSDGAGEKVNLASSLLSKLDSSPCAKHKMLQLETETLGQPKSSKDCQKENGIRSVIQSNGLSCINGDKQSGSQIVDRTPVLEENHANANPKKKDSTVSQFSPATLDSGPSTSKSGGEVIRTRISINVEMSDMQEKAPKVKEGRTGGHSGKSTQVSVPHSLPLVSEGAKRFPEACKAQHFSKSTRTGSSQEIKGATFFTKQVEQMPVRAGPTPLAKAEEAVGIRCKTTLCPSSVAKVSGKDPDGTAKSPKGATKIRKDSVKGGKAETIELGSGSASSQECRSSQRTVEAPSQSVPLIGAGIAEDVIVDDSPPPPAPFEHRIVNIKQTELTTWYLVCHHEVLGGGRFGQVHKCTEKSTDLCLAAKIIKVKAAKEREEVKNEINIMNQLNHVNLIQLYDAFECKNNLTLIMEYVDGGELFDRITDENYSLTELDAILFTKQICDGVYYLHQQYILHLDLKPENILCVSRTGNQIKIIDFGLARRYKPREKLKVNFGTPEFLAPEVVNYDFVSFPTDMWSVGVITYMLLSGLSPFLGESDTETMNYIVNCSWDLDAEAFEQVSEEAKDFISRLLIKGKSGRMSAVNCLKHEWLIDLPSKAKKSKVRLKSQLLLQSYMAQRKWKKHFYAVAAANRLRRFPSMSGNST